MRKPLLLDSLTIFKIYMYISNQRLPNCNERLMRREANILCDVKAGGVRRCSDNNGKSVIVVCDAKAVKAHCGKVKV